MGSSSPTLLAQWREANRAAIEAENAFYLATMKYVSGHGPKPTEQEIEDAKRLRAAAADLFKQAMDHLNSTPYIPWGPRPPPQDQPDPN